VDWWTFMKVKQVVVGIFLALATVRGIRAEQARTVTQYGITWTFDKPYTVGQFLTGDYWVLGPITVVSVSPAPQPAPANATSSTVKSIYGVVAMTDDKRMRNGSMIVLQSARGQGYDSRLINYRSELSAAFPLKLDPNLSLVSSISNGDDPAPVLLNAMVWKQEATDYLVLKSAAVLTCLRQAPPRDAFRPPYAGTDKPIYRAKSLRWEILPKLAPAGAVPDWAQFERYFERPWLDHIDTWLLQHLGPSENQTNYGREFSRATSIASLMLMLDAPPERKRKLMIGLVQLGIDLHGLAMNGRQWPGCGGHWNGRKWPILFAGLMLGDKRLLTFPTVASVWDDLATFAIDPVPGVPPATTIFSEDQQTYYGKGGAGQSVLYQIILHSMIRPSYEEKPPATYTPTERWMDGYRGTCSVGWPGTALAAQLMKAKALWDHDAFFDYCDRWMDHDVNPARRSIPIEGNGRSDPFVQAMWTAYRQRVPDQPGGKDNLKWVWKDEKTGQFVLNPKGGD
jgi:hypothetical protein